MGRLRDAERGKGRQRGGHRERGELETGVGRSNPSDTRGPVMTASIGDIMALSPGCCAQATVIQMLKELGAYCFLRLEKFSLLPM